MPNNNYRDDDAVQSAVRSLFTGSAPERERELGQLWQLLSPSFQLTEDLHEGQRFVMDAGAFRYVRFNHRAVRAFWIAGYVAWEGYRAIAECPTLDAVDLTRFKALLDAFDGMISSDKPAEEPLPPSVAEPGDFPDHDANPQGRATAELATIAAGWALLHEVRHIKHQQEGTCADPCETDPAMRHDEEMSCDAYATRFLLEQIDAYAGSAKVNPAQVSQKRQLGIYFALFALTLLTKDSWEASDTHPAVQDRIEAVRRAMLPHRSEIADAIAHASFAALRALWPDAPGPFFA